MGSSAKAGALSESGQLVSGEQAEQQQTGKQDVIRASDFNFIMVLGKGEWTLGFRNFVKSLNR